MKRNISPHINIITGKSPSKNAASEPAKPNENKKIIKTNGEDLD